jgi:DHA1 family multidrug resistance protein-like MFS transporter
MEERRRLLKYLYVTIFLTSTAYGTVTFLIPVYAEELGASYVELGIIGTVGSTVYTMMTLTLGVLLDKFERVRFYLLFCGLGVVIVGLFCLTSSVSQVVLVRGILGVVAAGFWVTASTLIADISPPDLLTQSIGRYNLSWIAGFVVGPYLGGIVSEVLGFQWLFASLSLINLFSMLVIWARISSSISLRNEGDSAIFDLSRIKHLSSAYLTLFPFSILLGIYMAIIPGHMSALGLTSSFIGLLLTTTNAVRGIGFLNVERFVRWGTRRSIWSASILLFAAFSTLAFSDRALEFLQPMVLYGIAAGIMTPVILDYIAHGTPSGSLGIAMGLHEGVYGLGMSLGPIVGGAIAEQFQPMTLYLLLSIVSLLIIPLSLGLKVEQT